MKKILMFSAPWCASCKGVKPIVEALEVEKEIIDVELQTDLALSYGVRNLPALIFIKNGEEKGRLIGNKSLKEIQEILDSI